MTTPRYLKVGGAALNQTPLDWPGNTRNVLLAIQAAKAEGVQVLCLPELCLSGYGCEDAFHGESVAEQSAAALEQIAPETNGIAVALGLPVLHGGALFNGVAFLVDGVLRGIVAKQLLAGYGVYYEPRWFKAWPTGISERCTIGPWEAPLGDLMFDLGGVRVGFEICEDAWGRGHGRPSSTRQGADLLLNPSASHFAFGKQETLKGIVIEGSRDAHSVYVYSNLVGNEAGRLIYDGTVLVASDGALVIEGPRFSYRDVVLTSAVVDLRANRLARRRLSYPLAHRLPDPLIDPLADQGVGARNSPGAVMVPFEPIEPSVEVVRAERARLAMEHQPPAGPPPASGLSRYEEFAQAVALGIWDYLRKSRGRGVLISLSGGVDSATVSVLGWLMARLALAELSAAGVRDKLGYCGQPAAEWNGEEGALTRWLLTTVYQSTANSSNVTRDAASGLAAELGTRHVVWDVEPLARGYRDLASQTLGMDLTWEAHDTALQNIQARVRSPGVWLLANVEGRLLLSTSNRSEVGVGYCTMDGDTSGGLAPIAGANKTFLRGWLRWMETHGFPGLRPLTALGAINDQAPTAELRPPAQGQADENDLMPYPVLDAIEQAAIRDRMAPLQVWHHLLSTPLPGTQPGSQPGAPLDPRQAATWVARFFELWSQSQWKRERLAPSFHLDDENLDPKTWCRFPILSGGYQQEIAALLESAQLAESKATISAPVGIPAGSARGRRARTGNRAHRKPQ